MWTLFSRNAVLLGYPQGTKRLRKAQVYMRPGHSDVQVNTEQIKVWVGGLGSDHAQTLAEKIKTV